MGLLEFWMFAITVFLLAATTGLAFIYRTLPKISVMEKRIEIMLKTTHHSVKALRILNTRIADLKLENHKILNSQSKAFDHQKVLLSSHNRQIRNLEELLISDGYLSAGNQASSHDNAKVIRKNTAAIDNKTVRQIDKTQKSAEGSSDTTTKAKTGVVRLTKILAEKNGLQSSNSGDSDRSEKIARLSAIFERRNSANALNHKFEEKRVSNG